ncbi:glutamate--tRNA ligase, partial [archaeon]|nr:glutamate--tRNA ligase [archaeon]
MKDLLRNYALQNAVKHEGKAQIGSVIGKLIQVKPELKSQLKDISKEVQEIVNEVNDLSVEEQTKELQEKAPELLEEAPKEKRHGLKDLPNVKGNVVLRFAPSPSGPLHVGHATVLSLNHLYAQKYKGKLLIRIEDTNPENIDPKAYELIPRDANWLTKNGVSQVIIQSSRLQIYHDYCERLIATGKAYVCTCDSEEFKKLVNNKEACPCREVPKQKQLVLWQRMFSDLKPGDAVVRIKTDLNNPNQAMRDWPAMRINDNPHPKVKARVWPLMNFSVAVDDHEFGITHTIRGKDHMDNAKRQKYLLDDFQWSEPTHLFIGKTNFEGMNLSTSETRKKIEAGEYEGWEDIRLPFLGALRRRGYQPEAFLKFMEEMGISQNDKTVTKEDFFKAINYHNKEILDPSSNRYFFIKDPVEITVENAPEQDVELDLHPSFKERGQRKFKTKNKYYITKEDHEELKANKLYRLMDCINFKKKG